MRSRRPLRRDEAWLARPTYAAHEPRATPSTEPRPLTAASRVRGRRWIRPKESEKVLRCRKAKKVKQAITKPAQKAQRIQKVPAEVLRAGLHADTTVQSIWRTAMVIGSRAVTLTHLIREQVDFA